MSRWQKHGSTSNLTQTLLYIYQLTFQFISNFVYKMLSLIEVLEFKIWQNKKFGRIKTFSDRKKMMLAIINELNNSKSITIEQISMNSVLLLVIFLSSYLKI